MGMSRPDGTPPAIVFDFGGVLVDWDPRHLYRRYFDDPAEMERFLEEIEFDRWNVHQDRGRPFAEGVAVHSARFPHRADLIAAYHEHWTESIRGPIAGTVEVLRELHEAGHELHGLSNWSAETFAHVRDQYPFFRWFGVIVLSGEERLAKPEPEIFRVLLERIGRPAGECLFIDDSAANVAAARELGFRTLRFRDPGSLRASLRGLGLLDGPGDPTSNRDGEP